MGPWLLRQGVLHRGVGDGGRRPARAWFGIRVRHVWRLAHKCSVRDGRAEHHQMEGNAMSAPPPPTGSLQLARLWERRDHEGRLFLSGTLNGLRLLLVPNEGQDDETDAGYLLLVATNRTARKPKRE